MRSELQAKPAHGRERPHGEHAEDVYEIERGALDERVVVAFRPERDIVWG